MILFFDFSGLPVCCILVIINQVKRVLSVRFFFYWLKLGVSQG